MMIKIKCLPTQTKGKFLLDTYQSLESPEKADFHLPIGDIQS
jgi:hypothetical protein